MIDDGILFSYRDEAAYSASVQRVRDRLCTYVGGAGYYVLDDRRTRRTGNTARKFAMAIFDENDRAEIDVCLLGNTLYILAMRLAERKWFPTRNQQEFDGCGGSLAIPALPFEGGYPSLGISGGVLDLPPFRLRDASAHCAAMRDYMIASAGGIPGGALEARCKLAFGFFAMTIAEAARFRSIESNMCHGGIGDPGAMVSYLQRWVIGSSVRDDEFPSDEIAIVGVHEERSGKVWKGIVQNLRDTPRLSPTDPELAGGSAGARQFLAKQGLFAQADKKPGGSQKTGYDSGYEFLLDAYFRSRVEPGLLDRARARFDDLARPGQMVKAIALAGLNV